MKHSIFFAFIFLCANINAQPNISIDLIPVCWSYNEVDSSLNQVVLISGRSFTPQILYYTNVQGAQVDISSGGNLQYNYCNCSGSAADLTFDGDRQILRVPSAGENIEATTISEWLEWWYFQQPSLTVSLIPSTTVYEMGDLQTIAVTASTSNPGGATLSNGHLDAIASSEGTISNWQTWGSNTFFQVTGVNFAPQQTPALFYTFEVDTLTFYGEQSWVFGSESGTISDSKTVYGVYPVLYGVSSSDYTGGGVNPYANLTKLVQQEGNKTLTLNGSGYIYFAIPKTWSDYNLSQIIDQNGFNVTASFTAYDVTISSTGKDYDWVNVPYKLYRLNTTTTISNASYQFLR